ncbi:hypothetical protein MBLNU457_2182t1 [Dothideomycetes sp. NU457]
MPHQIPASELQELARAQYQKQEYQKALTTITEAIEASTAPTVALLNDRAAVYEKLGETSAALIDTRAAIRLDETNVISYKRAGRILLNTNKHDKALEIYKRGLAKVLDKHGNDDLRHKHDTLARSLHMAHLASLPAADPLEKLPIELVEMVFSYLSFPQIVQCTRVSKKWKNFMCGRPTLWQDPDFTMAKKLVPKSAVVNSLRVREHVPMPALGFEHHGLESLSLKAELEPIEAHFGSTSPPLQVGAWLPSLSNLRKLVIYGFSISQYGTIADFRPLKHLKHLDMRKTDADAMMFPPSVEFLALDGCGAIRRWMLPPYLVSKERGLMLPNLKTLVCGNFDDAALLLWMSSENPPEDCTLIGQSEGIGSKLETLQLQYPMGRRIGLKSFSSFDRLEDVVDLALPTASYVDDSWAPWIVAHGLRLQKLNLEGSDITGYGLKKIIKATQLRSVNVKRCERLGVDAVDWARAKGVQITYSREETGRGRKVRY